MISVWRSPWILTISKAVRRNKQMAASFWMMLEQLCYRHVQGVLLATKFLVHMRSAHHASSSQKISDSGHCVAPEGCHLEANCWPSALPEQAFEQCCFISPSLTSNLLAKAHSLGDGELQ